MPRRPNHTLIKRNRSYDVTEAAAALQVTPHTVRGWLKQGLRTVTEKPPHLILGCDLRDFLQRRTRETRCAMTDGQFFCLTCKAPREPAGRMVDVVAQLGRTLRLVALCSECGRVCNRMIGPAQLPDYARLFDLVSKGGPQA